MCIANCFLANIIKRGINMNRGFTEISGCLSIVKELRKKACGTILTYERKKGWCKLQTHHRAAKFVLSPFSFLAPYGINPILESSPTNISVSALKLHNDSMEKRKFWYQNQLLCLLAVYPDERKLLYRAMFGNPCKSYLKFGLNSCCADRYCRNRSLSYRWQRKSLEMW